MKTPIYDFLKNYSSCDSVRLHMPGHKGKSGLGEITSLDITEIDGADSLYHANGIIAESESYASELFGCPTYYSTEGSSLAIRAMLHLAANLSKSSEDRPLILAGRNAHKVFLSAAALIDFDIEWLFGKSSYLRCEITADEVDCRLSSGERKPCAVYITSPDYLGNIADVKEIARVCHKHGVLLLVDNAHGAYLKFLEKSIHPMDLGADMCAASAHKTLSVLTGGAYLHISAELAISAEEAKSALSLYGSTSPSYLILASLDLANSSTQSLSEILYQAEFLKSKISELGISTVGNEPLKITLAPKSYGYTGEQLGAYLEGVGVIPEFCDPDYTVIMISENTSTKDILRTQSALEALPRKAPINELPPKMSAPRVAMSPREAVFSPSESVTTSEAEGRILSAVTVGCPPAVPIVVSGEIISRDAIEVMNYYGINRVNVVKK